MSAPLDTPTNLADRARNMLREFPHCSEELRSPPAGPPARLRLSQSRGAMQLNWLR